MRELMSHIDHLSTELVSALRGTKCSIFPGRGREWRTPNSTVASIPALALADLASVCDVLNLTMSIVRVNGMTHEGLHYHSSNIIGLIVSGGGDLRYELAEGSDTKRGVVEGDLVVIPRGAYHVFETQAGSAMDYIAFEFSDAELDYQAHWKPGT